HVLSWMSTREGRKDFLVIRYEDLLTDPKNELAKVAELLGIEATEQRLVHAVELSSADRMRKLENDQAGKWVQTKYTRQDKPFVRKASSGGWRAVLNPQSVSLLESTWGPLIRKFGYRLSTDGN
ncbi:MAG: sulfotransferase domain-containing protein, partial [Candidatus Sulfotelmatobacter sp.]